MLWRMGLVVNLVERDFKGFVGCLMEVVRLGGLVR